MAKKSLRIKQKQTPKFTTRAYTRCERCGRPKSVYRKFGLCRICLRVMVHAGELPGVTMADPIADMLTRIRNANSAMFDTVSMPGSKVKESLAKILEREGYIEGYSLRDSVGHPGTTLEIKLKSSMNRKRTIMGIKRVSK